MEVTLHPAIPADLRVAQNLVPYYMHDMSEYMGWACPADGIFQGCGPLPTFWEEAGKYAFMLRAGEEVAGFALVHGNHVNPDIDYSIAEFFVLRKFRHRGVGENIARELFDRFRGRWMVEQLALNEPAVKFWRKVIGRYIGGNYTEREGQSQWGKENTILFRNDLPADG